MNIFKCVLVEDLCWRTRFVSHYFISALIYFLLFIVLRMSTVLTKDQKFRNSSFSVSFNSDPWFTLDTPNKSAQSLSISTIAVVLFLFFVYFLSRHELYRPSSAQAQGFLFTT